MKIFKIDFSTNSDTRIRQQNQWRKLQISIFKIDGDAGP